MREVATMAELECRAHRAAFRQGLLAPGRYVADLLHHATHALRVEFETIRHRAGLGVEDLRVREHRQPEINGILACRQRALVEERLEHEAESVTTRRAHRERGHAERHRGGLELEVLYESRREFVR